MSEIVESLTLRRPITVHAEGGKKQIDVLPLKLPSGRTVLNLGEPFTTKIEDAGDGATKIEFKIIPAIAREYLAEMTGINADLLGQLHPLDVMALFDLLARILCPIKG
jgi:hypothetical protein